MYPLQILLRILKRDFPQRQKYADDQSAGYRCSGKKYSQLYPIQNRLLTTKHPIRVADKAAHCFHSTVVGAVNFTSKTNMFFAEFPCSGLERNIVDKIQGLVSNRYPLDVTFLVCF